MLSLTRIRSFALRSITYVSILYLLFKICQLTTFDIFRIPTESMAPTAMKGNHAIVNKLLLGGRIYNFNRIQTANDEMLRIPGCSNVQRYDIIIFNKPKHKRNHPMTMDLSTYNMKRCIGISGDSIQINKGHFYVNGSKTAFGCDSSLLSDSYLPKESFLKQCNWNLIQSGIIYVPKKGDTMAVNSNTSIFYRSIIEWELNTKLTIKDNWLYAYDKKITSHTYKYNYYFTIGDNLPNSKDSRHWGLIPESFIVGIVCFIL